MTYRDLINKIEIYLRYWIHISKMVLKVFGILKWLLQLKETQGLTTSYAFLDLYITKRTK